MDRRATPDDEAHLDGFESARLPAAAFGHAEHVRAAFLCLTRHRGAITRSSKARQVFVLPEPSVPWQEP
jgi:hypothetical protein